MKKRVWRRRRLSVTQAKKLSKIITILYMIVVIIAMIRYAVTNNHYDIINLIIEMIGYGTLLSMTGVGLYYIVYRWARGFKKSKLEIESDILKARIRHRLSETEFIEVDFQIENENSIIEMLKEILKAEGCKFYAKLDEEEGEIIIQCIDKHGDIVYNDTIFNIWYFQKNFKF